MLSSQIIDGLNTAFNEAIIAGIELSTVNEVVAITLVPVCANPDGSVPDERRVQILLRVGKIHAFLRNARWDDDNAKAEPFTPNQLLEIVTSFSNLPIYGWKFFDCTDSDYTRWSNRLSMQYESGNGATKHTLDLFQDGNDRILDIRIWFDDIKLFTPNFQEISIEAFIASGQKGWEEIYNGNISVQSTFNITPLKAPD